MVARVGEGKPFLYFFGGFFLDCRGMMVKLGEEAVFSAFSISFRF